MSLRGIHWKDADEKRLKKAINRYNRILSHIEEEGDTIPEKVDYQEMKSGILTRKGLNDKINSLNRLNRENATKIHTTDNGFRVSEYYWEEGKYAERRYKNYLRKEFKEVSTPREGEVASRLAMGTSKARGIEANLSKDFLKNLNEARDTTDFNERYMALINRGSEDFRYQKALDYKERYLDLLESRYSSFDGYEDFKQKVENMGVQKFLDFIEQDENYEDLSYMSDTHFGQAEFDAYLDKLGIKKTKKE